MGHLWLIGMMGTGKTTVGAVLAEQLGRPFIDIDTLIMTTTGRTIPELFDEGQAVFRTAESSAIAESVGQDPSVISTGGGAVLARENLDRMKRSGVTVLLTASVPTIVDRIGEAKDRPLAADGAALESLAELRMATYLAAADHSVDTEGKTPMDVAEEVLACIAM